MKIFRSACWIVLAFTAICLTAQSQQRYDMGQDFVRPTYQGYNVDWCLYWGATECGRPAADDFCSRNGYARAIDFDTRIMRSTVLLGDNRRCDGSSCKGFTHIRCEGRPSMSAPPPQERMRDRNEGRSVFFPVPQVDGTRVDKCVHWGTQCGQPAADSFCQRQGFSGAEGFVTRLARPTLILGDNQICNRADCEALENVRCASGGQDSSRRDWDRSAPSQGRDRTFQSPSLRGYAVDRCLYMGRSCDQPAADQFCSTQGYRRAVDFTLTSFSPTLVMGENRICNAGCHAFAQVTCSNY